MKKVHQSLLPILLQESDFFASDKALLQTIKQKISQLGGLGLFQDAKKSTPINISPYCTVHPWQMDFERRNVRIQLLHCQYRNRWEVQDIQFAA